VAAVRCFVRLEIDHQSKDQEPATLAEQTGSRSSAAKTITEEQAS
jgi:hypothetical protein